MIKRRLAGGAGLLLALALPVACASTDVGSADGRTQTPAPTSASASASAASTAGTAAPADGGVPVIVTDTSPHLPVTVTDAAGDTVTVRDTSRIVSLAGGISETLFALGLGSSVVGRDVSTEFPGTEGIVLVTSGHDVSAEGVLALAPTLVLADARTGPPEALSAIRAAGVPVVVVPEVWTLDEASARNDAVAEAVGMPGAGQQITDYVEAHAAQAQLAGRPVIAFLYLRGNAAVYLMGGDGSGADSIIEALGGVDAGTAAGLSAFTPLTPESLAESRPDTFLVMSKGLESVGGIEGLLAMPGIAQTPAGRDRRVIVVPDGELLSFGPRTPHTLADISDQHAALRS